MNVNRRGLARILVGVLTLSLFPACASYTKSFLIHKDKPTAASPPPHPGKALWVEGKFDEATVLFGQDCSERQDCENYLRALLALGKFDDAAPVARKACEGSGTHWTGVCTTAAELSWYLDPKSDLDSILKAKCDFGDHEACGALGLFWMKKGLREESEIPLRNACMAKYPASCHRLAHVLWESDKRKEAVEILAKNCKAGYSRSCRWKIPADAFLKSKEALASREKSCAHAPKHSGCVEAGILKLLADKGSNTGRAYLQRACTEYSDDQSCWEAFLEKSELVPAETQKTELASLCKEGVGPACRNLAELQNRLGKSGEVADLLRKGCTAKDEPSCRRLHELPASPSGGLNGERAKASPGGSLGETFARVSD